MATQVNQPFIYPVKTWDVEDNLSITVTKDVVTEIFPFYDGLEEFVHVAEQAKAIIKRKHRDEGIAMSSDSDSDNVTTRQIKHLREDSLKRHQRVVWDSEHNQGNKEFNRGQE